MRLGAQYGESRVSDISGRNERIVKATGEDSMRVQFQISKRKVSDARSRLDPIYPWCDFCLCISSF